MNLNQVENQLFNVRRGYHAQKINKWVLKLIGLAHIDVSQEDLLEFVSMYVHPRSIQALVYDSFNCFYTLFLNNIDSFCQLVGKKASFSSYAIRFLPLLDLYVVHNVYPSTTNEDLCETFGIFGQVFEVTNHHILPNSSKFSHVLSGKREISFTLPGEKIDLAIPINVFHHPYKYSVQKLCSACMTEGHSVLNCPDIDDTVKSEGSSDEFPSSDSELSSIIKSENISSEMNEHFSLVEFKDPPGCDVASDVENKSSSTASTSVQEPSVALFNKEFSDLQNSEFCTEQEDSKSQSVPEKAAACTSPPSFLKQLEAERNRKRMVSALCQESKRRAGRSSKVSKKE